MCFSRCWAASREPAGGCKCVVFREVVVVECKLDFLATKRNFVISACINMIINFLNIYRDVFNLWQTKVNLLILL